VISQVFNSGSFLKTITAFYCGRPLELTLFKDLDNDLAVGRVLLTRLGYDLAVFAIARPRMAFSILFMRGGLASP
jgi:hypothetical protein